MSKELIVHHFPSLRCSDIKIPKSATQSRKKACRRWRDPKYEGETDGWYVFTFVRHPLDRLVSLWANQYRSKGWEFDRFARTIVNDGKGFDTHWAPQTTLLDMYRAPDFIGRYERMDEDWATLQEMYPFLDLVELNKSSHAPWESLYTPDLRALVSDYYARDMEELGYE